MSSEFGRHLEVDRLLSRELVVLVQAGMQPVHAVRLVTDLSEVLEGRLEPRVDSQRLDALRKDLKALAQELCRAEQRLRTLHFDPEVDLPAENQPHRSWFRDLKTLGRGIKGIGGAATIAGNGAAIALGPGLVTGLGLASIVGGVEALRSATRRRKPHY